MSVTFDHLKPGDRVRVELAEPLQGWIVGEVHSARRNDVKLVTIGGGEMDYLHLVLEEIASVTRIEPPIKPGDLVWTQGAISGTCWVIKFTSEGVSPLIAHPMRPDASSVDVCDLPDDAVWLVRGGKLNPLLGGEA